MKEKNFFWRYFDASQSERNGFIILFTLMLILFTISIFIDRLVTEKEVDFTKEFAEAQAFYKEHDKPIELFEFNPNTISQRDLRKLGLSYNITQIIIRFRKLGGFFRTKEDFSKIYGLDSAQYAQLVPYINLDSKSKKWSKKKSKITPFKFNPNTATASQLKALGLSDRVVKTILNYRNKKGKFYKPKDFLNIYGVSQQDFEVLEPYIQLDATPYKKSKKKWDTKKKEYDKKTYANRDMSSKKSSDFQIKGYSSSKENIVVDINKSTTERWQLLYGIGPKLSQRITKFRDKLGGFYSIDQVASVYGLPDSTFQRIKPHLVLSPIFRKLDINSDDIKVLKSHPYLSWKKAKILMNYRENHGDFDSLDDLRKVGIFSEEELDRLGRYVEF